jgi:hypothetical protein
MSQLEPSQQQTVDALYRYAAEQMRAGVAAPQIESQLVAQGLDPSSAATVVRNLSAARTNALRAAGKKNMLYGAVWCIGGILITALTYSAASQRGGTYFITWGAIIFGAVQFFRGLGQYLQNQGVPSAATSSASSAVIENVDPWDAARPRVQPRMLILLGVIALVVVGGVFLFANAGSSGVKTSLVVAQATAADINLKVDDLGSGFSLTNEIGKDKFTDQDVRDGNQRDFDSDGVGIRSVVMLMHDPIRDPISDLMTGLESSLQKEFQNNAVAFEKTVDVAVGDQGSLQTFTFNAAGSQGRGHVLAFIKGDCVVMLMQAGAASQVSAEKLQAYAHAIESRIR